MNLRPIIYVKVPFYFGQQKFKILKGQRWGAIDHLLLQEIVSAPQSAQQLSMLSKMPKRLIIEILIPLMRVGWLELIKGDSYYLFQATLRGKAVATLEELPLEKEPIISTRQYIIDPCTGQCYRTGHRQQNFQIYSDKRVQEIIKSKGDVVVSMDFEKVRKGINYSDIFDCVSEKDEQVIGFDDSGFGKFNKESIKYALVAVDDSDRVSNLPGETSRELVDQIIKAAHKKYEAINLLGQERLGQKNSLLTYAGSSVEAFCAPHEVLMEEFKLILGASEHREHFFNLMRVAKTRLVIHSTFINPDNLSDILPILISAARRSVRVDILWGQVEPDDGTNLVSYQRTRDSLSSLIDAAKSDGLDTLINIHLDPTRSHSKFVICDDDSGEFSVTLGSCNWLSSGFNRFEASVQVSNKLIVSEMLVVASSLAQGAVRVSNDFSKELAVLANRLRSGAINIPVGTNTAHRIKMQIILKNHHYDLVRKARDEACSDIFVCSHRFSHVAERPVIAPLTTSIKYNSQVQANIFYGRSSGGMRDSELKLLSAELKSVGVNVDKIVRPTIHAKILAWDNDDVVITSLNWLSASANGDNYDEIGVYISGGDVAKIVKRAFEQCAQ
ncbi:MULTISPECIES: phospholipase D-like domain-containing protein [Pseudomonas syringae group]|uniref:PLD phosphodiesterase domain-containing protein n=1 Tax=Pseudomonas amygdali pv. tabaci TaxID=322 RepID=A0A3M6I3D7_PSEAJ|nr:MULTISPECIES: phospholipase D-like domain-containing protein [Pseudomonas syringae group]MDU8643946.1 phospholipase D-like domain-containing protein [Pseudomonas syringae group sp. 26L6]RMW11675.1 hypothetical protein ALP03_02500 [Pseudomonas amygdali pv. tabaci]